ncbi:MAG: RNA pseudouridine synthase [Bacteroidales bacterium]|nr:RNA pseudouridine synthase [Candidatus Cryptobacteroides choladohippi]
MEYRALTDDELRDLESRILYEDNHILIVNKKVGEITQGDKTGDECLTDVYKAFIAARDSKPGKVFLGLPHRLDRPVSGICILAKTSKALERLDEMFRTSQVHKRYWALCCGKPQQPQGYLENWLVRNERQNKTYVVKDKRNDAKLARLNYRYLYSTDRYHLLEVELLTGRHHQIRCQLSNMGCVIKGDLKYGAPRSNPDGGICLHSRSVTFVHPVKKEEISVTAPFPASWAGVHDLQEHPADTSPSCTSRE